MSNNTFRTKTESTEVKQPAETMDKSSSSRTSSSDDVEVPYLDYRNQNAKPYTAEYFKLGDSWDDLEGGFPKEIAHIEGYIKEQIETGELANSQTAIKNLLNEMEEFNNLTKEERPVVKIEVLSNYIEFLEKNKKVKQNLRRYYHGGTQ